VSEAAARAAREGEEAVSELNAWLPWIAVVISAASLLYTIFIGRKKDTEEKFKAYDIRLGAVAGKLDVVEEKVTIVQNDLKHLPDKETTHRLELSIHEMRTEMRGLTERMKPIGAMAERMQDAILEKVMANA
jgi:hypothetical protein